MFSFRTNGTTHLTVQKPISNTALGVSQCATPELAKGAWNIS